MASGEAFPANEKDLSIQFTSVTVTLPAAATGGIFRQQNPRGLDSTSEVIGGSDSNHLSKRRRLA
jgi:hypothetical protein